MKTRFVSCALALTMAVAGFSGIASAADGAVTVTSAHDVATTADKLEAVLKEKGMKVFARIKHSEGAKSVGVDLRDTELVIFGNPKVGSPLMKCAQTVAMDLPQKALIYQDADGSVKLTYNDPQYLKKRHSIEGCDPVLGKVSKALAAFSAAATAK